MNFGRWFAGNGDKVFTFITLASVALKGVDDLPAWASQLILVLGILATAAHQSFFPSQPPVPNAPPAQPAKDLKP